MAALNSAISIFSSPKAFCRSSLEARYCPTGIEPAAALALFLACSRLAERFVNFTNDVAHNSFSHASKTRTTEKIGMLTPLPDEMMV